MSFRILTLCVTAVFLLSILLIGAPISLTATASVAPLFERTILADWDTVIPTANEVSGVNSDSVDTVVSITASPSGYGNGLNWGRTDLTKDQSQVNHVFAEQSRPSIGDNKALVFWISVKDAGASPRIRLFIDDISSGSGVAWTPKADAPFTVVKADGTAVESTLLSQKFALPAGVTEGWVIIPFSSLQKRIDDGTQLASTAVIRNYNFYYENANVTGTIYLDEICMVTDPGLVAKSLVCQMVADFDTVFPTDIQKSNSADNSTAAEQVPNVSPYGTSLRWSKSDETKAGSQVNLFVGSTGNPKNTALVFWLSLKDFDGAPRFRLTMNDGAGWYLRKGSPFWTIGSDGTCTVNTINTEQVFKVDDGFAGWVVVPFDTFFYKSGRDDDPNLHPEDIGSICLYYDATSTSGPIYLDQFGFTEDAVAFMSAYGNYTEIAENAMALQTFDTGTVGTAAGEGIVAYISSDAAQLEKNSLYSDDGYSLYAQLTGNADIHIPLKAQRHDLLPNYQGIGFWMRTEGAAVTFTPKLVTDEGVLSLSYTDPTCDIYRLVDEESSETNAYLLKDNAITVPANFCGYVIFETKSFENGKDAAGIDMSTVNELVLSASAGNFRIDTLQAVIGAARFIRDDLHCKQDDDLIFAIADGWTVNDDQNAIVPVSKVITSTQFRESVALRQGYRMVFLDSSRYQVFGPLDSMENIAYVDVFLGGTSQTTYSFGLLPEDDEQDDTTSSNTPHPFDGFTSLLNGETSPASYWSDGGTMTREPSPSHYGKGFTFTVTKPLSETARMKLAFAERDAAVSTVDNEAIAFWVSVPETGYNTEFELAFTEPVDSEGRRADRNWMPYAGSYYTVDENGILRIADAVYTDEQGGIIMLSDGFSGWVILPLSSLKHDADATWESNFIYQMVMRRISVSGATASDMAYYLDEIGMVADIDEALEQLSDFSYSVKYNADATVTGSSVSASANATAATEISDSGRGNGLLWTRPDGKTDSQMNFTLSENVVYGGGLVFWMSVDETDGKQPRIRLFMNASITTGDTTTTATWTPDKDGVVYAIAADGTKQEVTVNPDGTQFYLPAHFSGWVVIPFDVLTIRNTWNSNVTFGDTTTITDFNMYYLTEHFDPSAIHMDEVGFTDDALGLVDRMAYNTALNATASQSSFADNHEVIDLMRTARKSIGAAADDGARKAAYDAAAVNLETLCNANKNNVTHTQDKNGASSFRFISEIDKAYLLYLKKTYGTAKVEFGTLIARNDLYSTGELEYTELTDKFSRSQATTIKRTSIYAPEGITPENADRDTTLYTCLISDIPEIYHDSAVRARSYVRYTDAYGVAHTVYGVEKSCSYNQAAGNSN